MNILGILQRLGRALQLPIAILPAAALLLRFGQADLLNLPFIAQSGAAVFSHLPLIFAIGVATAWSKDNAGAAGLAGAIGYLVLTEAMVTIHSTIDMGALAGILTGLIAGMAYNRFHAIKFPEFLSFFGGTRFVPIVTGFFCLLLAVALGYLWPPIQTAIQAGGQWIIKQGALGSGIFGVVNRLLIPTGLHQVLNSITWFQLGEFVNSAGEAIHGDLTRFFAGDASAGMFMSGFFPIMMFGLPGGALAMYLAVPKSRRNSTSGIFLSVALTSFLTGVTEPIEFLFMFLTPVLYLIHASLTGLSLLLATWLNIHAGFAFSAGAIDFALMYHLPAASDNCWMLLLLGGLFFVTYFLLFSFFIRYFNLNTPGRDPVIVDEGVAIAQPTSSDGAMTKALAARYLHALGGAKNILSIESCISRLRLAVHDQTLIDDGLLKTCGAKGIVRLGKNNLQVVVGTMAESLRATIALLV